MKIKKTKTPLIEIIWPRIEKLSRPDEAETSERAKELDKKIFGLAQLQSEDAEIFLTAALKIQEYEQGRRNSAETRANTIIATVATLFTLMTWALSNSSKESICTGNFGCGLWAFIFAVAVIYFVSAATASLQVLTVGNYEVVGVEDLIRYREKNVDLSTALAKDTLLSAHRNRKVINAKIANIKIAQQRFLIGLTVLGALLIWDPFARLDVTSKLASTIFSNSSSQAKASDSDISRKD